MSRPLFTPEELEELAHRVGVSQPLICMIERGRCGVVPQTMRMIEEALEEMEGAMT